VAGQGQRFSTVIETTNSSLIDAQGGRAVLAASNLVITAGLMILAVAHGIAGLVIAWTVLGVGIGMGLHDSAFAALTWLYGREARSSITGIPSSQVLPAPLVGR
jgi:hypothetical protein